MIALLYQFLSIYIYTMISNILRLFFAISSFLPLIAYANNADCVILIHGLARTHHSMSKIQSSLESKNYQVINYSYPSTQGTMEELADKWLGYMVNQCLEQKPRHIHIVTHSLGGIILQHYMEKHKINGLTNIVMLAPPNHGSPIVDGLNKLWFPKAFLGPSGSTLDSQMEEIKLLPGSYKIGVIAGNYTLNPFSKIIFKGDNDGKVAVESTKIKAMNDFIILSAHHGFMTSNKQVIQQTIHFLEHGSFAHS